MNKPFIEKERDLHIGTSTQRCSQIAQFDLILDERCDVNKLELVKIIKRICQIQMSGRKYKNDNQRIRHNSLTILATTYYGFLQMVFGTYSG